MQPHSTLESPPLDPFRSSPVRGQLEPYDPKTPDGWRYIQTTDTRNQLKVRLRLIVLNGGWMLTSSQVLLPPGTASMYEQLLKFEVFELRKKATLSWERILEIRHLKDRMIRKCHKLAKSSSSGKPSDPFTFQTIIAPSDFRVKAMENWFQQQQKRTNALLRRPLARPTGSGSSDFASRSMERFQSGRENINLPSSDRHPVQLPLLSNGGKRLPKYPETRFLPQPSKSTSPTERSAFLPARPAIPAPTPTSSPPPLPHLLRIRDPKTGFDLSADPQRFISHFPFDSNTKDSSPDSKSPPTPSKQQVDTPRPEIHRQRSCIKRTSIGDLVKTVSWADDRGLAEQVSKYTFVVRDVYASG
jgi:hypothetical protein